MRSEISVWVRSSLEAQAQDLLVARRRARRRRRRAARASRRARARGRRAPSESASVTSSPVGSSSERVRRALTLWSVARTSSNGRLDRGGELLDGRRAAELVGQLVARLGDAQLQLLQAARHAHRPRPVAEVALDLAEHRRRRVGGEAHLAREVEAVDRLHDPDAGDLHEVVERLAAAGVAARRARGRAAASPRRAGRARARRR